MKLILIALMFCLATGAFGANAARSSGYASWYGEEHRGRLMANGSRFDPDKLTAASWYYPLGTRVRVTLQEPFYFGQPGAARSLLVTITDRGPSRELVRSGRIIDLSHAAFRKLAPPEFGLVQVSVHAVEK